jgi:chemotaxis protein CheX
MAQISMATVAEVVQSIFLTMMDVQLSVLEAPCAAPAQRVTSSVYLEGAWNGAVALQCNRGQACQFAGQFLAADPPQEVDDDVRDVLGEIANMIGGNLKATMGTDVRLSLPSVIDGSDYGLHVCGSAVSNSVGFRYSGGEFLVTVLSKEGAASGDEVHSLPESRV